VIPAAAGAAAPGARVVHLGNSAAALATLAGPAIGKNRVSTLPYAIFTVPARERSGAFARLAKHAAAGELTVDYRETGLETLPAIWDDFAAGRANTRIIVTPNQATPLMTGPARTRGQQETTGPSPGFPAREPSPDALPLTSRNHQNLSARTGDGPVLADAPQPPAPSTGRGRPPINPPEGNHHDHHR
jgi:hypothetical protein